MISKVEECFFFDEGKNDDDDDVRSVFFLLLKVHKLVSLSVYYLPVGLVTQFDTY